MSFDTESLTICYISFHSGEKACQWKLNQTSSVYVSHCNGFHSNANHARWRWRMLLRDENRPDRGAGEALFLCVSFSAVLHGHRCCWPSGADFFGWFSLVQCQPASVQHWRHVLPDCASIALVSVRKHNWEMRTLNVTPAISGPISSWDLRFPWHFNWEAKWRPKPDGSDSGEK